MLNGSRLDLLQYACSIYNLYEANIYIYIYNTKNSLNCIWSQSQNGFYVIIYIKIMIIKRLFACHILASDDKVSSMFNNLWIFIIKPNLLGTSKFVNWGMMLFTNAYDSCLCCWYKLQWNKKWSYVDTFMQVK